MKILRPYQTDCIHGIHASFQRGNKAVILQLATGGGKTVISAAIIIRAVAKGKRILFLVHREELLRQALKTFKEFGLDVGAIAPGFERSTAPVQVAMAQTLARRGPVDYQFDLIITDECHHAKARTWEIIYAMWPDAYSIGITATPIRGDGKGLGDIYQDLVLGPTPKWLIENGYLSDYDAYIPKVGIDVAGIRTLAGDYQIDQLAAASDKRNITGSAVEEYIAHASGRQAIAFCVNVAHSQHVAEAFRLAGISSAHIDGKTDRKSREEVMNQFASGGIMVLVNCGIVSEGFDVPSVGCVIILRPTQSVGMHLQMMGRGLRVSGDGRPCIILDHAGNIVRPGLGLPDDEREWSLEGAVKSSKSATTALPGIRQCPKCYRVSRAGVVVCRNCGYEWKVAPPTEIEGILAQVKRGETVVFEKKLSKDELKIRLAQCVKLGDFHKLGKEMGYLNGWAKIKFDERQRLMDRAAWARHAGSYKR